MVKELIGQDADILLHEYNYYSFKEEQCVIYFKGSIHLSNEKADIEKWSKLLISKSTYDEGLFTENLLSELVKVSGLFSLVIKNRLQLLYSRRYY